MQRNRFFKSSNDIMKILGTDRYQAQGRCWDSIGGLMDGWDECAFEIEKGCLFYRSYPRLGASCTVETFVFLRRIPFQPPRLRRRKNIH